MMRKERSHFLATAFVLTILTCPAAHAQQQTPPENSNEVTTGAISGQVVNERGEPMPGASVMLRVIGSTGPGRTTSTDVEGRFHVIGLEAGLYLVTGQSPAYVPQSTPEIGRQPPYYRLGDTVRIELMKGAVITGTVANAAGEPVVGIRVRAFRIRDAKGQVTRGFGGFERTTDDRGIYRIYGLPPGTYLVTAGGGPGNQSFQLNPY
jgi:uncharacterized GH25 family protein